MLRRARRQSNIRQIIVVGGTALLFVIWLGFSIVNKGLNIEQKTTSSAHRLQDDPPTLDEDVPTRKVISSVINTLELPSRSQEGLIGGNEVEKGDSRSSALNPNVKGSSWGVIKDLKDKEQQRLFVPWKNIYVHRRIPESDEFVSRMNVRKSWTAEQWDRHIDGLVKLNIHRNDSDVMIMAVSNSGMQEMTMNFIASLKTNKYDQFLVICFDFELYRFLCEYGFESNAAVVPHSWVNRNLSADTVIYNSPGYLDLVIARLLVLAEFVKRGVKILLADVDLVFLSPFVIRHILFEHEQSKPDLVYMVDNSIGPPNVINGGFFFARPTKLMAHILARTYNVSQSGNKKYVNDQTAINYVIEEELNIKYSRHLSPLEKTLYPSGWTLLRKHRNQDFSIYPMVAHFNWVAGSAAKKKRMKELGMWFVGDAFA